MAVRPDYDIGVLNLTSGSANFTTSGSSLQTAAVQAGDSIIAPSGHVLIIASITGQNSGTLFLPCPPDAAGTGLPLRIRFQPDGSRYQGAVRVLIDLLSSGNIEAFASLVGAAGMVPIFTGPGTLDLADPATFGIQDPNGSLGKLAALTLAARQILQTDETGALTALTLAARQILQTDANGALKAVALAANKTLRTDANADIVLANVEKPLLAAYGGSDVAGLSQIVLDIPNEYVGAEVEIRGLRTQSGDGVYGFRCGPSGGTLTTSYRIRLWNQYGTEAFQATMQENVDNGQIASFTNVPAPLCKASIHFGSGVNGWVCMAEAAGWTSGGGFNKTSRTIWSNTLGVMRRIAIVSTTPFGNASETSVRIYGVR
ncbi:hypothetical protein [Brucella intermedia]|uniref:hypothetical protein n=1 Tax=Brucella intermedia TaxID=94625 RepID=UPI00244BC426|nr:hypothetical protein [Brucella intermedia]WGG61876.1 hypothetical protein QA414_15250 [Brucella intermedia]